MIGTLQECAAEKSYCMAIQAEGMVEDFVSNMLNDNIELRKHCASAIFKCAQEEETRALVKSNGGLEPLVALIKVTLLTGTVFDFVITIPNTDWTRGPTQ